MDSKSTALNVITHKGHCFNPQTGRPFPGILCSKLCPLEFFCERDAFRLRDGSISFARKMKAMIVQSKKKHLLNDEEINQIIFDINL